MENNEEKKSSNILPIALCVVVVVIILAAAYCVNHKDEISQKDQFLPESSPDTVEMQVGSSDIALTDTNKAGLEKALDAAEDYLADNMENQRIVSEYGFLYSYANKAEIAPAHILSGKDTGLTEKESSSLTDILYILPSDLGAVTGKDIPGNDLAIFAVLNTKDGYYTISHSTEPVLLSPEQYRNLVMLYSFAHGSPRNPKRGEEENTNILKACDMVNYDIKHIACDDKYAVVVGNMIEAPNDIKHMALMKDSEGKWNVICNSLEKEKDAVVYINEKYPDMELGLMPIYNIADFGEIDTESMPDIIDDLKSLGEINDADAAKGYYACGCQRFAYIECLATGKKLLGVIGDDGALQFNKTENVTASISYMLKFQEDPPVFILKFE